MASQDQSWPIPIACTSGFYYLPSPSSPLFVPLYPSSSNSASGATTGSVTSVASSLCEIEEFDGQVPDSGMHLERRSTSEQIFNETSGPPRSTFHLPEIESLTEQLRLLTPTPPVPPPPSRQSNSPVFNQKSTASQSAQRPSLRLRKASIPFEQKRANLLVKIISNVSNGGSFADGTLTIHSRRNAASGVLYHPRRLDVNKSILRAASVKFNQVFDGSLLSTDNNDYAEDSDLDWDDDNDTASSPNFSELDGVSMVSSIELDDHENAQASRSSPSPVELKQCPVLPGAHRTWKAMNLYLVTDELKFGPLQSQKKGVHAQDDNETATPCSPKSMYRLADMLDLFDLKQRSFQVISQSFLVDNIVEELFSDFTWRYPDILHFATDIYYQHCDNPKVVEDMKSMHKYIIISGKRPHASIVLDSINEKLVKMAKQARG
ncbi:hypothetical protein ABKN59_004835 [Abortiporus biennis]